VAHILIIDDESGIREALGDLLESEGYKVSVAANGREGLKCFRENEIDLVITDIIMPEQEGIETIRVMRKESPDAKIFAMSGGGRIEARGYLELAMKVGAARVFEKPLDVDILLTAMREILK
jgi:DNA-binding NtrC family response regulator